jgi:hypothetical protein
MALLVLSIEFLKTVMDLLVDAMDLFNEFGGFFDLILNMVILFMCGCEGHCYINGA